jgi:hypothetical protein
MSIKIYTITRAGRIMTHGSRNRISWRSAHWVLYRLKRLKSRGSDLSAFDVYISDFDTMKIDKMSASAFYETHSNPKETEAEIIKHFGFKTDIVSLKEMLDRGMFNEVTGSLVNEFLLKKGII